METNVSSNAYMTHFKHHGMGTTDPSDNNNLSDSAFRNYKLRSVTEDLLNLSRMQFSDPVKADPKTSTSSKRTRHSTGTMHVDTKMEPDPFTEGADLFRWSLVDVNNAKSAQDKDPSGRLQFDIVVVFRPKGSEMEKKIKMESFIKRGAGIRHARIGEEDYNESTEFSHYAVNSRLLLKDFSTVSMKIKVKSGSGRGSHWEFPQSDFLSGEYQIWGQCPKRMNDIKDFVGNAFAIVDDEHERNTMLSFYLKAFEGDYQSTLFLTARYYAELLRKTDLQLYNLKRGNSKNQKRDKDTKKDISEVCKEMSSIMQSRMEKTLEDFVEMNCPILLKQDVIEIHNLIQTRCPLSYHSIMKDRLSNKKKKEDLRFRLIVEFIRDARTNSQKNLTTFGLILAYAIDAESGGTTAESVLRFESLLAGDTSFERDVQDRINRMNEMGYSVLKDEDDILIAWDNFQEFVALKFLRAGKSVHDLHATVRYARKMNRPQVTTFEDNETRQPASLTYTDQAIAFPPNTFPFELLAFLKKHDYPAFIRMVQLVVCGEQNEDGNWTRLDVGELKERLRDEIDDVLEVIVPNHDDDSDNEGINDDDLAAIDLDDLAAIDLVFQDTINDTDGEDGDGEPAGTTGKRTEWYYYTIKVARALREMKRYFASEEVRNIPESIDGSNQNIKGLLETIKKGRKPIENAVHFQEWCVASWNEFVEEVTQIYPLTASMHKENSIAGNGKVFEECSDMCGFIRYDDTGKPTLDPRFDEREFCIAGDVMTIDMLLAFFLKTDKFLATDVPDNVRKEHIEAIADIIHKLSEKVVPLPGDFHFSLHQLACIFQGHYAGFLQCFQCAAEFRNVTADPKEKYQKSRDFLKLIGIELGRCLWKKWLLEGSTSVRDGRCIIQMALSFIAWKEGLLNGKDEVVTLAVSFYDVWNEFEIVIESTRSGDSVLMELMYRDWLPVFTYWGKSRYKECSLRQMEGLYRKGKEDLLHLIRCNRFIRLNKGRAMIALDAMCEHLNRFMSEMKDVKSSERLVEKSSYLALSRACKRFVQLWMTGTGHTLDETEEREDLDAYGFPIPKSSISPRRLVEMRVMEKLILDAKLLEVTPGRNLDNLEKPLWAATAETQKFMKEEIKKLNVINSQTTPGEEKTSDDVTEEPIGDAASPDRRSESADSPANTQDNAFEIPPPASQRSCSSFGSSFTSGSPERLSRASTCNGANNTETSENQGVSNGIDDFINFISGDIDNAGSAVVDDSVDMVDATLGTITISGSRYNKLALKKDQLRVSARERGKKKLANVVAEREIKAHRRNLDIRFQQEIVRPHRGSFQLQLQEFQERLQATYDEEESWFMEKIRSWRK